MDATNNNLQPVDAKVVVNLYAKNMSASVTIYPPENGGRPLDAEMLLQALAERSVIQGIDAPKLMALVASPVYRAEVVIATGRPPQPGENGSLRFLFDQDTSHKPKEREDGTVDYRDLSLTQNVLQGQLLAEKTPATDGVAGMDVLGNVLPARSGRDAVIPAGKNTRLSEDGLQLLAATAGHVEVIGGKVTVLETFVVHGDVSSATGNINFTGSVTVSGSVLSGYSIYAAGSVSIRGACEAATIVCQGNVTIGEGMNGGRIEAVGDVKSKYLQSCDVQTGGSIYAGAVINCNLHCGGSLIMSGAKATIMGGSCSAAVSIETMFLGSASTFVPTRVEVGMDPLSQGRLAAIPKDLEQVTQLIENLNRLIGLLEQYEAAGRLDKEKTDQLYNARYTREMQMMQQQRLIEEIEELTQKKQEAGKSSILAKGSIAPGVRIVIGAYQMAVNDPISRSRVVRGDDGILVQPYF